MNKNKMSKNLWGWWIKLRTRMICLIIIEKRLIRMKIMLFRDCRKMKMEGLLDKQELRKWITCLMVRMIMRIWNRMEKRRRKWIIYLIPEMMIKIKVKTKIKGKIIILIEIVRIQKKKMKWMGMEIFRKKPIIC